MAEQEPEDIPGVTRPYTFTEAAKEAQRLIEAQLANGETPHSQPVAFQDSIWPSPDGKGIIYFDPNKGQHIITAYDRSNVKPGTVISTGLTGHTEVVNPTITPPRNSQN